MESGHPIMMIGVWLLQQERETGLWNARVCVSTASAGRLIKKAVQK